MKLKQQITLMMSVALLVPVILITSIAIYQIQNKATAEIDQYRTEEYAKLKLYLKHITDVAYGMVETKHSALMDSMKLAPQGVALDNRLAMEDVLRQLSKIRFDKGEGYFWVTDNKLPYPTMIMHAEKANLKGQTLNDAKYNVEKYKNRNIYQVRAELANANGEAFVEYIMKKPGTDEVENKISYSRLYAPLGWIVSTGFYTDQIEQSVIAKKNELGRQINQTILFIVGIGIVILGLGIVMAFYFSRQLTNAVILIKDKLKELSLGKQVNEVATARKDEVGDMIHSLNALVKGLQSYTSFAKEIGKDNLDQEFTPLSSEDVLGNELIQMRNNLKQGEKEKRLRDWTNEGLAQLGEVLRRNNTDTRSLADEVLSGLVKYIKINQGALFIASDTSNDGTLDLVATYAYDKRKFINRKIAFGEGLAGQCVLERNTIHLKQVPADYVKITSGLGQALPRTILLVPLVHNEKVYGVLEMASFKPLEDYEIAFIEKIAESIASTISTVQTNERTKRLLEKSQQMSEEMKAQEEELRQNQEELQATQESMRRRQVELEVENERLKRELHQSRHNDKNGNDQHLEPGRGREVVNEYQLV